LAIAGGRQDHYAATHGGALGLEFTDVVGVPGPVQLKAGTTRSALEQRRATRDLYWRVAHFQGDTITAVLDG